MRLVLKLQCLLKKCTHLDTISNNDSRFHILITNNVDIYECWLTRIYDGQPSDDSRIYSAAKRTIEVLNAVAIHKNRKPCYNHLHFMNSK